MPVKKTQTETGEKGYKMLSVVLRGRPGSPLVVHAFAEKARKEIEAKQAKAVRQPKAARDPRAEFLAARYVDAKGRECAPIAAIKKAIVSAAVAFADMTKVSLRQAIMVYPAVDHASQLVPIELHNGKQAVGVMRTDVVTIGINTRDLAYRPGYEEWQLRADIEYNARMVSTEQLIALIDQAGWGVGICEGRPEKTSALSWGRFERLEAASGS